jgi:hypothetical protein
MEFYNRLSWRGTLAQELLYLFIEFSEISRGRHVFTWRYTKQALTKASYITNLYFRATYGKTLVLVPPHNFTQHKTDNWSYEFGMNFNCITSIRRFTKIDHLAIKTLQVRNKPRNTRICITSLTFRSVLLLVRLTVGGWGKTFYADTNPTWQTHTSIIFSIAGP